MKDLHPGQSGTCQLQLPFRQQEDDIRLSLQKAAGCGIQLTITDNSASMLSVKKQGEALHVRMHRMFLSAGTDVIGEIAVFIKGRKIKTPLIREFIKHNRESLAVKARRPFIQPQGRRHNLLDIFERINREYFECRISSSITWGTTKKAWRVRCRTLGSYSGHADIIRVNPVLDSRTVPLYFIEFIVYHEMLHADMGIEKRNGRRRIHPKEFRQRERLFRDYEKAMEWERRL